MDETIHDQEIKKLSKELKSIKTQLLESEERFYLLFEKAPLGYQSLDAEGIFIDVNQQWLDTLGYKKEEVIGQWFGNFLSDEYVSLFRDNFSLFKAQGQIHSEFEMRHKDGRKLFIAFDGKIGYEKDGTFKQTHCILQDITGTKAYQKALEESERRLTVAQSIAHVGDWEIDLKTNQIWASEEAYRIYGLERTGGFLDFKTIRSVVYAEYLPLLEESLSDLIYKNAEYNIEFKVKKKNSGQDCFIHSRAFLEVGEAGSPAKVIGTIQDVTEQKTIQEELYFLSYHDYLTGLYNRRFYEEKLSDFDTEENLPITILLCDVNGLKLVNDSFGHTAGDELLKKSAKAILASCGKGSLVARHGGDEFVIVLPKTDERKADQIITEIKERLKAEKDTPLEISISIGRETKTRKEENVKETFKHAEDYMYSHKLYESRGMRSKTVDLIINTLYETNNREMLHSKRVSELCEAIANGFGMNREDVSKVRIAGLMHDIGKVAIDDVILNKADKLTAEGWDLIKKHSEIGYRILSTVNEFSEIADFVLEHQEKWDGSGYPKGLKGEQIKFEARIITVADSYDAMTGIRPYGRVFSKEEAIEEMKACAGNHFDPAIVKVFLEQVLKV